MTSLTRTMVLLLGVGGLLTATPDPAAAQRKKPAAARPAAPAAGEANGSKEPQARVERTERGGKVIKLTPIVVEGKVQKPLALVLARSQVQYDWEQLKKDFTPKIIEAVSKSPF